MFKLIKWGVGLAVAGALLLLFFFGNSASSYVGTALGSARRSVKEAIPIDFEIQRSERLIKQIEPQIQECLRDVALGEVELGELKEGVAELREREANLHVRLLRRKEMLETGEPAYFIAGLKMERSRLELDLERIFEDYRTVGSLISARERLLTSQEKSLDSARRKLDVVLAERVRLQDLLRSLKTQKRQVDAMAAQSRKFFFDDSSLVQARNALKEVKKRLDVAQRMLEADLLEVALLPEVVPPRSSTDRDILYEVGSYLREKGLPALEALEAGERGKADARLAPVR